MQVEIREIKPRKAVCISHRGPYPMIRHTFAGLAEIRVEVGPSVSLYSDDPEATPADELRSDAGAFVPDDFVTNDSRVHVVEVAGGAYAVGTHIGSQASTDDYYLEAMLGLVDGLMELLLALQMIIRIGLLDALLILAPAGLLCYAWPRLQGMAELWGRLFVVMLLTQFVQIVILHMGEDLVLYAPLVFGKDGQTIVGETSMGNMLTWMQYLIALGVFVVVLRVPRILRGYTGTPLAASRLALRSLTGGFGGRGGSSG